MKRTVSLKIIIIIFNLFLSLFYFVKKKSNDKTFILHPKKEIKCNSIACRLRKDELRRIPKYILLMDFYINPYCNDLNAYYIFNYYLKNNNQNAYYIINCKSDLYKNLVKQNRTQNLLPVNTNDNIINKLYNYFLNSKIIINSYVLIFIQKLVNEVPFLKYLYLTHAVGYFKKKIIAFELKTLKNNKRNIIVSSPYEYNFYKKHLNYSDNYMHKAGLPRYDRFNSIKKNNSEKQCILITFTYRKYSYELYKKSLFKKNIEHLLRNKLLINFLKEKKIDLIYIPHHFDVFRNRTINPKKFPYVKYTRQELLGHYIEQCSLFITDFSSISIDFMFLNKPSLFYLIDLKDKIKFEEREYMQYDYEHYFGNVFVNQKELIERVKYYANREFKIDNELKKNYESLFYYKKNITEKIIDIINEIIKKK